MKNENWIDVHLPVCLICKGCHKTSSCPHFEKFLWELLGRKPVHPNMPIRLKGLYSNLQKGG